MTMEYDEAVAWVAKAPKLTYDEIKRLAKEASRKGWVRTSGASSSAWPSVVVWLVMWLAYPIITPPSSLPSSLLSGGNGGGLAASDEI